MVLLHVVLLLPLRGMVYKWNLFYRIDNLAFTKSIIEIGDDCMSGPNASIYTAGHPHSSKENFPLLARLVRRISRLSPLHESVHKKGLARCQWLNHCNLIVKKAQK